MFGMILTFELIFDFLFITLCLFCQRANSRWMGYDLIDVLGVSHSPDQISSVSFQDWKLSAFGDPGPQSYHPAPAANGSWSFPIYHRMMFSLRSAELEAPCLSEPSSCHPLHSPVMHSHHPAASLIHSTGNASFKSQ